MPFSISTGAGFLSSTVNSYFYWGFKNGGLHRNCFASIGAVSNQQLKYWCTANGSAIHVLTNKHMEMSNQSNRVRINYFWTIKTITNTVLDVGCLSYKQYLHESSSTPALIVNQFWPRIVRTSVDSHQEMKHPPATPHNPWVWRTKNISHGLLHNPWCSWGTKKNT